MHYRNALLLIVALASCGPALGSRPPASTATSAPAAPTMQPAPTASSPAVVTRRPLPTLVPTATVDSDVQSFTQTEHTVRGAFRRFWSANGGVPIFGLPLTEQIWLDGKLVQFFERARIEQRSDGRFELGLVGSEAGGAEPVVAAQAKCRFFAATGHNLCGAFLQFWQARGGLAIFGLPLGEAEEQEVGLVQRFERATMELPAAQAVQLARLGDAALARVPGGALLRPGSAQPATQRAAVAGPEAAQAPLDAAELTVTVPGYSGAAAVTVADGRGTTWRQTVTVSAGVATLRQTVLGALGAHGVLVEIDGRVAGLATAALRSDAQTALVTGQPRFDRLLPMVRGFMDQDMSDYTFGDHTVHGYRSPDSNLLWLRDHVHQSKGFAYWEPDMRSLLDQFRRFQHADGAFDDYMANFSWGEVRGRTAVEADNEYLFIEGVYRAWQATGDDRWMAAQIAAMESGLQYILTSPDRWDSAHQLVKRPFTVDTWDFEYGPMTTSPDGKPAPRHWIDADTKWSIFHGDNTGYAHSMRLLAAMYLRLGNGRRAAYWEDQAAGIMARLNALAWNGTFYRHMVHLVPVAVPGVDEAQQLSLSNAYALNRSVLSDDQAAAIIGEYARRYEARGATFAEWYSIDPPFPAGSLSTADGWGKQPGEYVNGGIMPLVGGELARGALTHGAERYGLDILQRYYSLIDGTGGSYLWYHPIGQPGVSSSDTLSTDGWGSSAMLAALLEGVAGITDDATLFTSATLAPRWAAADEVASAAVTLRYGASAGYLSYRWQRADAGLDLTWTGSGDTVQLHLLLPADVAAPTVLLDGQPAAAAVVTVGASRYVDLKVGGSGAVQVRW